MLASYEHDFKDCVKLLEEIIDDADPASKLDKNSFALENANKLLKQMEVEAMNFMEDDSVRKRVSATMGSFFPVSSEFADQETFFELTVHTIYLILSLFAQMTKYKSDFDKLRKKIRQI